MGQPQSISRKFTGPSATRLFPYLEVVLVDVAVQPLHEGAPAHLSLSCCCCQLIRQGDGLSKAASSTCLGGVIIIIIRALLLGALGWSRLGGALAAATSNRPWWCEKTPDVFGETAGNMHSKSWK